MKKKPKLNALERDQIAVWLAQKIPLREISRRLDRSVSTISDEIKRNSVNGEYRALTAELISQARNRVSRKTNPLKDPQIYSYVVDKLRCGWSPEQIAGRLKRDNNSKTVICHETIYRYIYSKEGRKKQLAQYLTRNHKRRRKRGLQYQYRRGIQGRTSIHDRPQEIDNRSSFGHWETDIVEGRGHSGGIQTMLERKTRYYQGQLIPKINSEHGIWAQKKLLTKYPRKATKSVTFDNGRENYNHKQLKYMGINTYFCDPYCSWQKGANENCNGILRRYIPKKTDFSSITQVELDSIIEEINHTPRKCLNFQTPHEAFQNELQLVKERTKCSDSQ